FSGGGQVGLDERELGETLQGAPASSLAAHLYFDWPDGPLGFIVGEDVQVRTGDETKDHVLAGAEPACEAAGVGGGGGAPVEAGGQAAGGQVPVAGEQAVQDGGVQGGLAGHAGGRGGVAGLDQQAGHLTCPRLPGGLELVEVLQVAQQVSSAPGVQRAGQVRIADVAVADDDAVVAGQHAAGVDRVRGTVSGVQAGEVAGAGQVD